MNEDSLKVVNSILNPADAKITEENNDAEMESKDEQQQITIDQLEEDKVQPEARAKASKIEMKFFKAMVAFQKRDFRKAKSLFQRIVVLAHRPTLHKREAENSKINIIADSVHMVNLINMIELKFKSYSEHELKFLLNNASQVFMRYPYPDIFVKPPKGVRIQGLRNTSILDLIIDCIISFKNPHQRVVEAVSFPF